MLHKEMLITPVMKIGRLQVAGASSEGVARVYLTTGTKSCYGFGIWEYPNDQVLGVQSINVTITQNMAIDQKTGDWVVVDIYKDAYLEFDHPW